MIKKFKNKVCIITGGARGIGLQTTRLFADYGAKVIAIDLLNIKSSQSIFNSKVAQAAIDYLCLDVSQESSWLDIIGYIKNKYNKLNVLVNNAAINGYDYTSSRKHDL